MAVEPSPLTTVLSWLRALGAICCMYGPYLTPLVVSLAVLRVVPASLENCVMWFQNPVTGGSRSACWSRYRAIWLRSVWAVVCTLLRRGAVVAPPDSGGGG